MVDERRLEQLLRRVNQNLRYLAERAQMDREAIRSDLDRMTALKHFFQTAIEGCIDVAQHLCASEGLGPTRTNADSMYVLAANGVLERDLARRMADAVGFRNVIVHQYAEVDDDTVIRHLDELDPLVRFVTSVSAWLEAQRQE